MVLVGWGLTPLQNGIFSSGVIAVPSMISLRTTNSFLPLNEQSAQLGVNILNTAYSLLWLGQDMPPFTTLNYTLAPFEASQMVNVTSSNQTLSSETVLYGTDLTCRPPSQVLITKTLGLTFDDGQGCVAQDLLPISDGDGAFLGRFAAYYIGYYDNANVDWDLQLAGCPIQASHEVLVVWKLASNTAPPDFRNSSNATALFCTPNYYSQSVRATVSLPGCTPLSVQALGPKIPLLEQDFNITQFEYLVANGIDSNPSSPSPRQEITEVNNIHQDSRLQNMSLTVPTANMVGFAVGSTHLPPEAYMDPSTLHMAFQRAHRLLFSVAIQAVLNPVHANATVTGYVQSTLLIVSLVPVFVYLSEALLILVALLTCYLLYVTFGRRSALFQDPDSLAQIMCLSSDVDLQRRFISYDAASTPVLSAALRPSCFALIASSEGATSLIKEVPAEDRKLPDDQHDGTNDNVLAQQMDLSDEKLSRPVEYSYVIGLLFSACLVGMITLLILLHEKIRLGDGEQYQSRERHS